jgi:hypothetical protein
MNKEKYQKINEDTYKKIIPEEREEILRLSELKKAKKDYEDRLKIISDLINKLKALK